MKPHRNILEVIDKLIEVEPSLKDSLSKIKDSCRYTAPEVMRERWNDVSCILQSEAPSRHPKFKELQAIFNNL